MAIDGVVVRCEPRWGERTWELPFARRLLADATDAGRSMLEVGDVLGRPYGDRVVVDRYERGDGIVSTDLLEYRPGCSFDRIRSVSTLEHLGFDEAPRRPGAFRRAFEHLYEERLAPGGRLVFTVPLGHNPEVKGLLREAGGSAVHVDRPDRRSGLNDWAPAPHRRPVRPYDCERHAARCLAVGIA